jgi:hypothetical protein
VSGNSRTLRLSLAAWTPPGSDSTPSSNASPKAASPPTANWPGPCSSPAALVPPAEPWPLARAVKVSPGTASSPRADVSSSASPLPASNAAFSNPKAPAPSNAASPPNMPGHLPVQRRNANGPASANPSSAGPNHVPVGTSDPNVRTCSLPRLSSRGPLHAKVIYIRSFRASTTFGPGICFFHKTDENFRFAVARPNCSL